MKQKQKIMKTLLTLFLIIGALVGKVEAQYSYTRGTGTAADPYQIATAEGTNYQKIDTIIINRSYFGGGSGTAADPYLISDTSQLAALARYVNQGNGNATIGAHYALIADLDLTGWGGANGWEAIGIYKTSTDFSKTFQGFFHGKGHRIRNLSLNRENTADQGLFGYVKNMTIDSLRIENANVTANANSGIIAGSVTGNSKLSYCSVTGRMNGTAQAAGGLVGYLNSSSKILNSSMDGDVTGTASNIGGIVGVLDNSSSISNCSMNGNVSGGSSLGGIVGYANRNGSVDACYMNGHVDGGGNDAGGIAGRVENNAVIRSCYAAGSMTSTSNSVGGIVGFLNGGIIKNCYARNTISADIDYAGGLVGCLKLSGSLVENSVALNPSVSTPGTNRGRVLGYAENGVVRNNYASNKLTITKAKLADSLNGLDGVGKKLIELQQLSFYTTKTNWYNGAAWSMASTQKADSTWRIDNGCGFPYFQWQTVMPKYTNVNLNTLITTGKNTLALQPAFHPDTLNYEVNLDTNIITIVGSAACNGSVAGNVSKRFLDRAETLFTLTVTSEDGSQTQAYTILAKLPVYTITANAAANGSISPVDDSTVVYMDSIAYTITPDFGYDIDSVWVNDEYRGNMSTYVMREVSGDSSIFVTFTKHIYTVQSDNGPNGSIDPYGNSAVAYLDSVVYTITPDFGYDIDSVWVNDEYRGNMNEYVIREVSGDSSIFVTFTKHIYTVTSNNGPNGIIDPSGNTPVAYLDSVVYTITPDFGYDIDSVWVNDEYRGNMNEYIIREVSGDSSIFVSFKKHLFKVTSDNGPNGSIDPYGNSFVAYMDDISYTITPDNGYRIDSVFVNDQYRGHRNTYTFRNVQGDSTIYVTFVEKEDTLNYWNVYTDAGPHGRILPSEDSTVLEGSDVLYTIIPDFGYDVDSVWVNDAYKGNMTEYTIFNICGDSMIRATFKKHLYTLTAIAGPNGTINPAGDTLVAYLDSVVYKMTPAFGYDIDSVFVGGQYQGNDSIYTFRNVQANDTIYVKFTEIITPVTYHTVTAAAGVNGTITPEGDMLIAEGGSISYTIQADSAYAIDSVYINNEYRGKFAFYTFENIQGDSSIYVVFTAIPTPEDPKIIDMVITGDAVLDVPFSPDITTYNVQMPCTREAAFTFFAKEGDTLLIDGEAYLDSVKVLYSGEEGAIEQLIVKMNNTANAAEYTFNLSIPYDSTRIIQPYDNMLEVVNNPEFYDGGEKFKDDGYYQWYLDGQPIPGATNGILYFGSGQTTVANGNYSVEVTYLDGTKNRICPVSFAQPQQVKMLVYPNPTTGKLTVDDGQWTMKGQIKVYNMSGACVGKFVAEGHNTEINIDYLPTGIYVVRAGNKSVTAIKQ